MAFCVGRSGSESGLSCSQATLLRFQFVALLCFITQIELVFNPEPGIFIYIKIDIYNIY